MNILFVADNIEKLGIESISALLKKYGHKVELYYIPSLKTDKDRMLWDTIERFMPDAVGFSITSDEFKWSCELAEKIKKRYKNILIIFGGPHPTLVPEMSIKKPYVDIVCIGEGEMPMQELFNRLSAGKDITKIKNLWVKKERKIFKNELRPFNENLDDLPRLDKDLFYNKNNFYGLSYSTVAGRGCPHSCTYCCNSVFRNLAKGKYVRLRSVDNLMEELKYAKEKYKPETIRFEDDVFIISLEWLREFSEKYKKEIGIPFWCLVSPITTTEEKIKLLKDAGCIFVNFGIQTANEDIRKKILNRHETNKQILDVGRLLKKYKIKMIVDHIGGIPYETEEDFIKSARLYNELRPDYINFFWMAYFPKTPILDIAKNANFIDDDHIRKIEEGIDNMMISVETIINDPESKIKINSEQIIDAHSQSKLVAQFAVIMYLIPVVPKKIMNRIIEKRLYRKMPVFSLFLIRSATGFYRSLKEGLKSPRKIIRYYKAKKNLKETYSNYL